jgi:hypothetical protein
MSLLAAATVAKIPMKVVSGMLNEQAKAIMFSIHQYYSLLAISERSN